MDISEIQDLIASNAKTIQAISESLASEKEERQKKALEWEKDRNKLYQYLGRIAAAQSNFYELQGDYYQQLAILSDKHAEIEEQHKQLEEKQIKLEEQQIQMQSQIIELLKKLSNSPE